MRALRYRRTVPFWWVSTIESLTEGTLCSRPVYHTGSGWTLISAHSPCDMPTPCDLPLKGSHLIIWLVLGSFLGLRLSCYLILLCCLKGSILQPLLSWELAFSLTSNTHTVLICSETLSCSAPACGGEGSNRGLGAKSPRFSSMSTMY